MTVVLKWSVFTTKMQRETERCMSDLAECEGPFSIGLCIGGSRGRDGTPPPPPSNEHLSYCFCIWIFFLCVACHHRGQSCRQTLPLPHNVNVEKNCELKKNYLLVPMQHLTPGKQTKSWISPIYRKMYNG